MSFKKELVLVHLPGNKYHIKIHIYIINKLGVNFFFFTKNRIHPTNGFIIGFLYIDIPQCLYNLTNLFHIPFIFHKERHIWIVQTNGWMFGLFKKVSATACEISVKHVSLYQKHYPCPPPKKKKNHFKLPV